MSNCEHDWREELDGDIRCSRCTKLVSTGWVIDALSDTEALVTDLRDSLDHARFMARGWRRHARDMRNDRSDGLALLRENDTLREAARVAEADAQRWQMAATEYRTQRDEQTERLAADLATLRTRAEKAEAALGKLTRIHGEELAELMAERDALGDAYDRLVSAVIGETASAAHCFDTREYEREAQTLRDRATKAEAERDEARAALVKVRDAARLLYTACNGMRRDEEVVEAIEVLGDVLHALGGDK